MIKSGRVTVDGAAAVRPDMKIEEQGHSICVDGAELCTNRLRYFMMDKPEGVLSATEDKLQETVLGHSAVGYPPHRSVPGRTARQGHERPAAAHKRRRFCPPGDLTEVGNREALLRRGGRNSGRGRRKGIRGRIVLGDGTKCLPAKLVPLGGNRCHVIVMEGKYHQVKRMLALERKACCEAAPACRRRSSLTPRLLRERQRSLEAET